MNCFELKAFWFSDEVTTTVDTLEFLAGGIRVSDGCCHIGWQGKDCTIELVGCANKC